MRADLQLLPNSRSKGMVVTTYNRLQVVCNQPETNEKVRRAGGCYMTLAVLTPGDFLLVAQLAR